MESYDERGNRLRPVAVTFNGSGGSLTTGEEVVVEGVWRAGVVRAKRIRSLTTGASVSPFSWRQSIREHKLRFAGIGALAIAILGFIGNIAVAGLLESDNPSLPTLPSVTTPGGDTGGGTGTAGTNGTAGTTGTAGTRQAPAAATRVVVPVTVGLSGNDAFGAVTGVGLTPDIDYAHSATVAFGDVISSSPKAGAKVKPGSTVKLIESSGAAQPTGFGTLPTSFPAGFPKP